MTPRPEWRGQPLKPAALAATGEEHIVEAMWKMDEDEKYPGEFAMSIVDDAQRHRFMDAGISWFASGDLKLIAEANVCMSHGGHP